MERFTVAVLVRNQFGVLNRVTSMFRRRQFNIACLTVSETETKEFSRITILFDGEENTKQLLINQLYKLPDVCSIQEFNDKNSVSRELMLIKIQNQPNLFDELRLPFEVFDLKAIEYTSEAVILQMIGEGSKIDEFLQLMHEFTILEICRTGCVSLEKGGSTIRKVTNF